MKTKNSSHSQKNYRSAELARLCGVSPDTLRFYERRGLLPRPPRLSNNYRQYPTSALGRVQLIRSALSLGFTTGEIRLILQEKDDGGIPCRKVRSLAQQKLEQIIEEMKTLKMQRVRLEKTLSQWDERLRQHPNRPAQLLEFVKDQRLPKFNRMSTPRRSR